MFDGFSGELDHALASPDLIDNVTGATIWHINADEALFLDYNTEFNPPGFYQPDAYRSSDHDPLVVGISLDPVDIEGALADLQGMVADNPGSKLADKAEDAAAQIEKALAELDKTPPDIPAAFGALEGAAGDLQAMVKETGQGQDQLEAVVAFARALAEDAGANLAKGDALRAQGKYKAAVAKYKDAYAKAA